MSRKSQTYGISEMEHADRQTDRQTANRQAQSPNKVFILCSSCMEHIKTRSKVTWENNVKQMVFTIQVSNVDLKLLLRITYLADTGTSVFAYDIPLCLVHPCNSATPLLYIQQ